MQMLEKQKNISAQIPMPVTDMESSSQVTQKTGETITFVVASTNVNDAGSAAGTVIYARLLNDRICDSAGNFVGHGNDSSFAFVTATCLTTQKLFPQVAWETSSNDWSNDRATKMAAVGALLANGEFCLDHRTGLIIGKKANTNTSDTANYKYRTNSSAGGAADGTAFTAGTSPASLIGGLVDDVSTSTVAENSTGAVRMTTDRALNINPAYLISGENQTANVLHVRYNGSFVRITTATTTTAKSGAGHLKAIVLGTTAAGAITVYDNTAGSGTVIAALKASIAENTYVFDANFSTGLTIVTAAASDLTVIYS